MIGNLRGMAPQLMLGSQRGGVLKLSCRVEQGELELSANLGCVRQIQEELSSAVPMGPTPIFR